ncbi:MAG TPA: hypothetical protein VEH05_03480 [Streptosporangiaceae bacterium]|nr:hypothetical protein [Streptosporangiaceae bacterium]
MTAGSESPLTPELARRLAAELAPHLVAMRAVTAGTRYAAAGPGAPDPSGNPVVSPATRIFIAGMLERISA